MTFNPLAFVACLPLAAMILADGFTTRKRIKEGHPEQSWIRAGLIKIFRLNFGTIGISILVAAGLVVLSYFVPPGISTWTWAALQIVGAVSYWIWIGKVLRKGDR